MPAASKSACSNGAPSWCGGPAVTRSEGLDEWSLVGLTRDQGIARWSALFMGRPPVSRMTMSTNWGWVTWASADSDTAHVARMSGRVPPPLLVEIAVSDPDSARDRLSPRSPTDSVTTTAWCGLTGLIAGGVTGFWFWGFTVATLVLAVAVAAGAVAAAALWRRLAASIRPPVRILTERDAAAAAVFEGAKLLTSVTDQVRIHQSAIAPQQRKTRETPGDLGSEFRDAEHQLRRGLWALAAGQPDDPRATLTAMTEYAARVVDLIETRDRVRRASVVRVAPPARPKSGADPAAERLRDAARRLDEVIDAQRHAADVIGDINRRFDETG